MIEVLPKQLNRQRQSPKCSFQAHYRHAEIVLMFQFLLMARCMLLWIVSEQLRMYIQRGLWQNAVSSCRELIRQSSELPTMRGEPGEALRKRLAYVVIE